MALALGSLAGIERARGRYAEAETASLRAIAIIEAQAGPEHPGVGILITELADGYRAQGRLDKAEPLYRRSLAIFEHAAGWNHPLVLKALGGLAEVRRERGDPAEAERLLTRAIGVMDQSPDTLTVQARAQQAQLLTTLALVYRDQGRSTEADAAQARARSLSVAP